MPSKPALMPIALDRGLPLVTTPPARMATAMGDRRRVEQIVTNLASNAFKFGRDGVEVELAAWFDGPVAIIAVRDEGPGIGAEDRAHIFERFYRMADHERVTGTGLGLSISRDLARRMGGDLDVASRLGVGSAFVLVLPGPSPHVEADVDRGGDDVWPFNTRTTDWRRSARFAQAAREPLPPVGPPHPRRRPRGRRRGGLAPLAPRTYPPNLAPSREFVDNPVDGPSPRPVRSHPALAATRG